MSILLEKQESCYLAEARAWIESCTWLEDPVQLEDLTDKEAVTGINRHYYGGWKQFCQDVDIGFTAD
jgi:hypothetical protein